jgi:hypothetical protein
MLRWCTRVCSAGSWPGRCPTGVARWGARLLLGQSAVFGSGLATFGANMDAPSLVGIGCREQQFSAAREPDLSD